MDTQPDTLQLVEDLRDSGARSRGAARSSTGSRGTAAVLVCVEILHAVEQRLLRGQRADGVESPRHRTGSEARRSRTQVLVLEMLDAIRQVKEAVGDSVVIVSGGNVRNCAEADEALELAKAGGVMSAEGAPE